MRETVLRIQLKPDGSVASVTIEKASGVDALDEEAVRAVKAAAPYADGMPAPAKLMNAAGLIEFRMALVVAPQPPTADKK